MRTIIAGSRDFNDVDIFASEMKAFEKYITTVVCGGARGADDMGRRWAIENNIYVHMFPANWKKYGKSAGIRRNVEMAKNADALIAFWDGKSVGTKHMIDEAKKRNLKLYTCMYRELI